MKISKDYRRRKFFGTLSDGKVVCSLFFRKLSPSVVEFYHTETEPEFRGQGYAGQVVDAALAWARNSNFTIVPSCTFVAFRIESGSSS